MGRYDIREDRNYPKYRPYKKPKERLEDTLEVILCSLDKNIAEARLRVLMNDIYEYLERFEGFHYGISEKAAQINEKDISSKTVTLDHAVPSKVLIEKLKITNPNSKEALLNFFRQNYFLCFITKNENLKLDKEYRQRMPDTWNSNWQNWDERYKSVGIFLKVLPGQM